MIIVIFPTEDFLSNEYDGFADDEFNLDEITILTHRHSFEIEVQFGEIFEIPKDFYGIIANDECDYYSSHAIKKDLYRESLRELESGKYKLDKIIKYDTEYSVIDKIRDYQ